MLNKLSSVLCSEFLHIIRDFSDFKFHTLFFIRIDIDNGMVFYEVNNTLKGILTSDWKLDRKSITFKTVFNHIKSSVEVSTHNIHLINEYHTRYFIFISLAPYGFRLWLNTALCTKNSN